MMDIKQLRDTGELSDFTVYIGKSRFKLHKFPLYTKSEYFKEVASANPVCELSDFPGGAKTFSLIADFCYGKPIDINASNCVYLRVGAEDLRMKGKEGLQEITKCRLDEIFSKVVESKEYFPLMIILTTAHTLKATSAARIIEDAMRLIRSQLVPDPLKKPEEDISETTSLIERLMFLPLDLVTQLVKDIGLDTSNKDIAYKLISKYLERILNHYVIPENQQPEKVSNTDDTATPEQKKTRLAPGSCPKSNSVTYPFEEEMEKLYVENPTLKETLNNTVEQFDAIFEIIPDENELEDFVTTEWTKQALVFVETSQEKPKCKPKILKIAYQMLSRFNDAELAGLSPKVLGDLATAFDTPSPKESGGEIVFTSRRSSRRFSKSIIPRDVPEEETTYERQGTSRKESIDSSIVDAADQDDNIKKSPPKMLPESLTKSLVKYLVQKADEKSLTTEEFLRLMKKIDLETSDNEVCDNLIKLIVQLKKTDRELTEQEKAHLLQRVDLSKCSIETLSESLKEDALPTKPLAEAAIKLAEAEKNKSVIPLEDELPTPEPVIEAKINPTLATATLKDDIYKHSDLLSYEPSSPSPSGLSPATLRATMRTPAWSYPSNRCSPSFTSSLKSVVPTRYYIPPRPKSRCPYDTLSSTTPTAKPCCHYEPHKSATTTSETSRLLRLFEEELRRELSEVPSRAYSRALHNSCISKSYY